MTREKIFFVEEKNIYNLISQWLRNHGLLYRNLILFNEKNRFSSLTLTIFAEACFVSIESDGWGE